jgi:nitrilase
MPLHIAAIQMVSGPDLNRNLEAAGESIAQAAQAGAQLVALPEYFCLLGHHDRDKLKVAEAAGAGPIQDWLSLVARRHRIWLVGGTMPIRVPGRDDRVRNTCWVINPQGEAVARYDKIHLFAYDNGRERYDEAQALEPGDTAVAVDVQIDGQRWKLGLSVCYDLRFPELYRALGHPSAGLVSDVASASLPLEPCDLICVPSAFTFTTGRAHWELLLRARAVENQCYVLAPAQGGHHENGRHTWGHTMAIDPWGEVLAQQDQGAGVVLARLQRERLQQVRLQLPAWRHRRF